MGGLVALMLGLRSLPPLSVSATGASGSGVGAGTVYGGATSTPSGGVAPYSYNWTYRSGDTRIDTYTRNAQNPTFSANLMAGDDATATWRVTVTDSVGQTAFQDVVNTFTSF